jgi:hypothetical protein
MMRIKKSTGQIATGIARRPRNAASKNKNMNNKDIVVAGIAGLNDERSKLAVSKAKSIIVAIESEQVSIKARLEQNKASAEELKKLETLDLTYGTVVGGTAPAQPNVNQAAIIKAIEEMQKDRSVQVAAKSKNLAEVIATRLQNNKAAEERITNLRKELAEIEQSEVKATDIVG